MQDSKPVSTPLDVNHHLRKGTLEEQLDNPTLYQAMIGSMGYLVSGSRPDLVYTIHLLSQFNSCPNQIHLQAAKRTLRYLNGTKHWKLFFPAGKPGEPLVLEGFADASYSNNPDIPRSVSGYVFCLGNSTILWRSRVQKSVAVSTTEAEYMALSLAARQTMWLKQGLRELRIPVKVILNGDNTDPWILPKTL